MGMPRDLAYRLITQTVLGAATMMTRANEHPGKLKYDVTSPAGKSFLSICIIVIVIIHTRNRRSCHFFFSVGSTAEGLFVLEMHNVRAAMMKTIQVATEKSREISSHMKWPAMIVSIGLIPTIYGAFCLNFLKNMARKYARRFSGIGTCGWINMLENRIIYIFILTSTLT